MRYQILLEQAKQANSRDITDRLLEDGRVIITQEQERGSFERVVSDVLLELSDMDGVVGGIFAGARNTSRWYIRIMADDRLNFYGVVKPEDVERNTIEEKLRITAYSMERAFWDAANTAKCGPRLYLGMGGYATTECTLQYLLNRDLKRQTWVNAEAMFLNVDAGPYANRMIRDYLDSTTNIGRWKEIAPETTWKTYLEQLALYYNAEYYIDVATSTLKMVRRQTEPASYRDIDPYIVSDQEYRINIVSQDTYDYLYCFANQEGIEQAPTFNRFESGSGYSYSNADVWFRMTAVLSVAGGEVETMPGPVAGPFRTPYSQNQNRWAVFVNIPSTFASTVRRHLYQRDAQSAGQYKLTHRAMGNDPSVYGTGVSTGWLSNVYPPTAPILVNAWHKFDEATGQWASPLLDIDNPDPPTGRIKDVRPMLQFHEIGNRKNTLPFTTAQAFAHFKNDLTNDLVKEQYKDLFISKPMIEVKVEGIDWKIGDGIVSTRIPGLVQTTGKNVYQGRVKRAIIDLLAETTILGVMPV